MKVTGRPDLTEWGPETRIRQKPGPSSHWQDSVVLAWYDVENTIGGFHRLGHQPNYEGGGMVSLWSSLQSSTGMYKNTTFKPLREKDLLPNGGFGCGDDTCTHEWIDGREVWKIQDGDISAELRVKDLSGNVDAFPKKGSLTEDFAASHFDVPGVVTGWLKMKGKEWKVNGLGVRDHGWGTREWDTILSHRWVVGTCGTELSFVVLSWHSVDDDLVCFGWVIRDNVITFAKDIDLITYVEIDAASNRGGHMKLTLTTDEVLDIECNPTEKVAPVSYHHGVCVIDNLCTWTCGDWKGICDFETTANFQRNERTPKAFSRGIIENGFHPASG